MVFTGMTPEQIDLAANQLRAKSQELISIRTRVNGLVAEAASKFGLPLGMVTW